MKYGADGKPSLTADKCIGEALGNLKKASIVK